jgi:hypothetical protein
MRINEDGLFPALEAVLKKASEPLDCQTLYDMPAIREHAASVNRVSDYLGGLWRKGKVVRHAASRADGTRGPRWAYSWKGDRGTKLHAKLNEGLEYTPKILADRPSLLITEEGSKVTIELPNLILVIMTK